MDRLIRKYRKIAKDLASDMRDLTLKAATYAHSQVPPYPEPPSDSTYTRTGTMGRTITPKIRQESETDWAGILGTPTEYAPWVISKNKAKNGAGGQAWMHRDRWWTLQDVVMGARDGIIKVFVKGIKRLIREADNER